MRPAPNIGKLSELDTSLLLYGAGAPVHTALKGIFTSESGHQVSCKTKKISSESIDLLFENPQDGTNRPLQKIPLGSSIQLNLEEVGSFGGVISSERNGSFQISVESKSRSMLSTKLAHMAVKRGISPKDSIATGPDVLRIEPKNKECRYDDHMGVLRSGKIVNLSRIDALVRASALPPAPSIILFRGPRQYAAEITSTFEIGFMAKFCTPILPEEFSADMKFMDM